MRFAWPVASLRAYLVVLSLVAAVPTAVMMAVQALQHQRVEEQRVNDNLASSAALLAQAVEREQIATAEALRQLVPPDHPPTDAAVLAAFRDKAPRRPSWGPLFLLDAKGRALAQTAAAPTPQAELLRGQSMVVTGLVAEPTGQHLAAVIVPLADGRYWLGVWIDAKQWQRLLEQGQRPKDGVATLYDRQRRAIARTLSPADDGGAQYIAWHTVPGSGWGVGVGMPAEALDREHRQALLTALGVAALCLLLGVTLSHWLARSIAGPLEAIGAQVPTPRERVAVREIAELRNALAAARIREAGVRLGLQRKADEFEAVFQGSPVGLAVAHDARADSVVLNQALHDLLQSPPGAAVKWPALLLDGQALPPEAWPLQRAARTGEPVPPTELTLDIAGGQRHVLIQAVPLRGPDGSARGAISVVLDVTEARASQQRLLAADRQLRDAQSLVDFAQQAGGVGFFHYAIDDDALAGTSGYAKLFGLKPGQPPERFEAWLERIDPADRELVAAVVADMRACARETSSVVFRLEREGGAPRWISARLLLRFTADARPWQLLGAIVDITEQQHAEQERSSLIERERHARREAEDANRAKDEFLAMLGHELRNPLNGIATAAEVLNLLGGGGEKAADARATIARQTQRLARLLTGLLDTASVVSGNVTLARTKVDLAAAVAAALASLQQPGEAPDARIDVHSEPAWVDGDTLRLEQIASHLIGNALKYTPDEGRIQIVVRAQGEHAVLEVRDEGRGMAPDLLARVFEPFVQGRRPLDRAGGGLGLGLTLVQRLVQMHGGGVSAESSAQGSVFRVLLPRVEPPAAPANGAPDARKLRPRSVLLVEDDEDALRLLQAALELDGHEVGTAADGAAGLRALLERRPEIAVIDIGLPSLNGLELARLARGAGYAGHLIALSGYGQRNNVQQALRAGFDAHLNKPVDFPRLREMLARA